MRRDLIARACVASGEAEWTLKDPLSLAYFRLCEAEYVVLGLLDGRTTYGGLLEALQRRFPGERWSLQNIKTFLSSLIQSGLVTSLLPGQGRLQAQRRVAALRQR